MIQLLQRPKVGTTGIADITLDNIARGWTRSARAVGGYYAANFDIDTQSVTSSELRDYFNTWLGRGVRERAFGITSWDGFIYKMNLIHNNEEHEITLEPDLFHNHVDVYYSQNAVQDIEQGALSYTDEGGDETFTDAGQDWADWETVAGDAVYKVKVANSDGTTSWAYLGAKVSATEIRVFNGLSLAAPGWNGEDPSGLTPESYQVVTVLLEGVRTNTGIAENSLSQDTYGTLQYILSLGGAATASAEALRDRDIAEYGWPRSRFLDRGTARDMLSVTCVGYWATLFWQYTGQSFTDNATDAITTLANSSEFITAGLMDTNALTVTVDAHPMPQRTGDLIVAKTKEGDAAGNIYKCGVYNDRKLRYEVAPTTAGYTSTGAGLVTITGSEVIPQLLRPGFLVRTSQRSTLPPGTTAERNDPGVTYVDQVEYSADGTLALSLVGRPGSSIVLQQQIQTGSAPQ